MEDAGFGPVNDPEQRKRFTDATGNWSELLHELGMRIRPNPSHWQEYVNNFYLNVDWLEQVGLVSEARPLLKVMHEYGDAFSERWRFRKKKSRPCSKVNIRHYYPKCYYGQICWVSCKSSVEKSGVSTG